MKVAKFEKISKCDFNSSYYDSIILPRRMTEGSCGYDFYLPYDIEIKAHESLKVKTSIRCKIKKNYALFIFPRSSLGFKYKLTLDNTVGIIDSDYYYSDNEGHIILALSNNSDTDLSLKAGDRIVQGVFLKYHTACEEKVINKRNGGFGSTN